MNAQTAPLSLLVAELKAAKVAEAKASAARLEVESRIVALFAVPDGGEGTVKDEEFSIAFKVNRTVDSDKLTAAWTSLSDNAQKAFTWKASPDLKQLRALKDMDPKGYAQAANFITAKPAKPTITLKD